MLRELNVKHYTVDYAIALIELEIASCKKEGIKALKILHGYGSHGKGGAILLELRRLLPQWKRSAFIKDFFGGDSWNMFDQKSQDVLFADKEIFSDSDLGRANPGITIVVL